MNCGPCRVSPQAPILPCFSVPGVDPGVRPSLELPGYAWCLRPRPGP